MRDRRAREAQLPECAQCEGKSGRRRRKFSRTLKVKMENKIETIFMLRSRNQIASLIGKSPEDLRAVSPDSLSSGDSEPGLDQGSGLEIASISVNHVEMESTQKLLARNNGSRGIFLSGFLLVLSSRRLCSDSVEIVSETCSTMVLSIAFRLRN